MGEAGAAEKQRALRQIEYYMSDESLPFDEYLLGKIKDDGWIEISELASFPKMKTITKDVELIVSSLKDSDSVVVSEDGKSVKRQYPTPDKDPLGPRTVHASGFKCAEETAESISDNVRETLQKYGEIESVRPLRNLTQDTRALDGSAFVVFKEEKGSQLAAAADGFVSKGRKITVHTAADWFQRLSKKRASMNKKKEKKDPIFEKDAILTVHGIEGEVVSREHIRSFFEPHATVKFVEFVRGQDSAYVRLQEGQAPGALKAVLGDNDTVTIGDCDKVTLAVLQGDKEQEYWQRANEAFNKKPNGKRRGGGRGGDRGNKRQRP